jgi:lipoprotein-anchoring transpeptidase ErfK/SrfK
MPGRSKSPKFSRRRFGALAAAAPVAASTAAKAQTSPAPAQQPRPVSPAIAKFDVPMATEPGFIYKP